MQGEKFLLGEPGQVFEGQNAGMSKGAIGWAGNFGNGCHWLALD